MHSCLRRRATNLAIACGLLGFASGCGFGTAGIIAGVSNGGGGGNAPSTPAGLQVLNNQVSPATIRIVLTDAEADAAEVEFFYQVPGQAEQLLTRLDQNPVTLAASRDGITHELPWDFATEPGGTTAYVASVTLVARVRGGVSQSTITGLGNDAPTVTLEQPSGEISGIGLFRLEVSDSSADPLDVKVEYFIGLDPTPRLARPAGTEALEPTPEFAFRSAASTSTGVPLTFFWDTGTHRTPPAISGDLVDIERQVRLRVTAMDSGGASASAEHAFRVDNNQAPVIQFGEEFVVNPDDRRGIPIPVNIIDAEGDPVRLVLQWRSNTQPDFPTLDTSDPDTLAVSLQDDAFLRDKQICLPFPAYATGYAVPVGNDGLRLDEFGSQDSRLASGGMDYRKIELMRPLKPASLAATWPQNHLSQPTAVRPIGNGATALVLDGQAGASRLVELELATGAIQRTVANALAGSPSALDVDRSESEAIIATDMSGTWTVFGVDLATGTTTELINASAGGASSPAGPLRSVLRLGTDAALATAGNALWRLSWSGSPTVRRLVDNLAAPHGLAHDPLRPAHVLIAERTANRVISYGLDTGQSLLLPATAPGGGNALQGPTSLAIQKSGAGVRLLALCETPSASNRQVSAVALGHGAPPIVASLATLPVGATAIAAGESGLLLVTLPDSDDLVAGGGVEQRRRIVSFDTASRTITVDAPFAPPARSSQPWRTSLGRQVFEPVVGTPAGRPSTLVWDTSILGYGNSVRVRVLAADTEFGQAEQTTVERSYRNYDSSVWPTGPGSTGPCVGDIDGDGLLDFACANRDADTLTIYFQDTPRSFTAINLAIGTGAQPARVVAADFDNDGDADLACIDHGTSKITLFRQGSPRSFPPAGQFLELQTGPQVWLGPRVVANLVAADFNSDGKADLACTNTDGGTINTISMFLQAGGSQEFISLPPIPVGGGPTCLAAGDLDGDGRIDLAVSCLTDGTGIPGSIWVLRQGPSGTFAPQTITVPLPSSVAIADVDGDGLQDLVCGKVLANRIAVLGQTAAGSFTTLLELETGNLPTSVVAADLDSDGDIDVACSNATSETISVFRQESPGVFKTPPPLPGGPNPNGLTTADLDGDGRLDLLFTNADFGTTPTGFMTTVFGEAARTFIAGTPTAIGSGSRPGAAVAADMDADGDLEIVTVNNADSSLTLLVQGAPRSFAPVLTLPTDDVRPTNLAAADLDGDGDMDLVSANKGPVSGTRPLGSLTIYRQDSPGGFTKLSPIQAGTRPTTVAVADLDGNGALDLAVANEATAGTVSLLFQTAPLVFGTTTTLQAGNRTEFVTVADLNGDSRPDVVCANRDANTLSIFYQQPSGQFSPQLVLQVGLFPTNIVAVDVDGDNDRDLVCANQHSHTLSIYLQSTPGVFPTQVTLPTGLDPTSVNALDLDGDGDIDLATTNQSGSITLYMQDTPAGPGTQALFRRQGDLIAPAGLQALITADIDGDGDPDLVTVNIELDSVVVYYGRR